MSKAKKSSKMSKTIKWFMGIVAGVVSTIIAYLIIVMIEPPSPDLSPQPTELEHQIRSFHRSLIAFESATTNYFAVPPESERGQRLRDAINPYSNVRTDFEASKSDLVIELNRLGIEVREDLLDVFFIDRRISSDDTTTSGLLVKADVYASSGEDNPEYIEQYKEDWTVAHRELHEWLVTVLKEHDPEAPEIPID